MGSCCFTPTKRDFLWWYWLFLASIVGIPMLLAVLYVAKGSEADDQEKRLRGKRAAWIFWTGTLLVAIAISFIVHILLEAIYPDEDGRYSWERGHYYFGWATLAVQFFLATAAANGTNSLVRKRPWYVRIPLVVLCLGFYLVLVGASGLFFRRPAIHVMQFMVCMLPAHYWGGFKDSPDTSRAWKAFWAFFAAAGLFFLVSYFGEDFAQLICGPPHAGK